jgi:hypothetical protein
MFFHRVRGNVHGHIPIAVESRQGDVLFSMPPFHDRRSLAGSAQERQLPRPWTPAMWHLETSLSMRWYTTTSWFSHHGLWQIPCTRSAVSMRAGFSSQFPHAAVFDSLPIIQHSILLDYILYEFCVT